jgi:hypothetical protein
VPVRDRKIAGLVAEVSQAFLLIERYRVVHLGLDALVEAVLEQLVASLGEDDVEMEHALAVGRARRHAHLRNLAKGRIVVGRVLDALGRDVVHVLDQPVADDGLHGIEAAVVAEDFYLIAVLQPVVA